ncbi:MAG: glycoside hydrolase family 9 protein [Woeseiaceae bacterium]
MLSRSAWSGLLVALSFPLCCSGAPCDETESAVRLNQVGFDVRGPKRAVISAPDADPRQWELVDRSGEVVAAGRTEVFGNDPVSGEHVHRVDFSDFEGSGDGFRITSGCAESHPFVIGDHPYGRLAYDALAYFYHNRSGVPVEAEFAGEPWARPAGHPHDQATCREDVDSHGNDWPGCDYTLDLTGGWYDAGDHGKYVVNGGIAAWTLMNVYERRQVLNKAAPFGDGRARIPESGNGTNDLLDEVRFELEFFLEMQAPANAKARVPVGVKRIGENVPFTEIDASGMAHHKIGDENWTGLATPPHLDDERRVLYPVSTAATLNLAATAAQCARIWRDIDEAFSDRCLAAAERAYAAAMRNPEVYFIADFSGSGVYGDSNLSDEFFWAAAELFVTTGDPEYAAALRASRHFAAPIKKEPSWPRVAPLGVYSLALVPNELEPDDVRALRQQIVAAADRFSAERKKSGYHIPFASDEYHWGSNSSVLNRAIMLALAYDFTGEDEYRNAVIDAMDYILGRNPLDQSFVSGYGERPLSNPHHRFWARSVEAELPPPPPGALSGGPNSTYSTDKVARELIDDGCAPQTCWADDIRAYSLNEVAINWNAPLVWVAAFLDEPPP